jgi:hypothetical protein
MNVWWPRMRYLLALLALCSIATCPTAKRSCTGHHRAREADQLLEYLADRVEAVVATTGKVPPAPAGPTPATSCCSDGGTCKPDDALWATPGWRALEFSIDGDFRYQYEYAPDPGGESAVLRARGDLDCNEVPSLTELQLVVHDHAVERTWTHKDRYE